MSLVGRLVGADTEESRWRRGAKGEEEVGKRLDSLDRNSWQVLHDLPLGPSGWNLDHLVIGRGGVFCLNTKNLTGKVKVTEKIVYHNGHRTRFLEVARSEASQAARRLTRATGFTVEAVPVVVIMNAEFELKSHPPDVAVIKRRQLPQWFGTLPPLLPLQTAAQIWKAAQIEETWTIELSLRPRNKLFSRHGKLLPPPVPSETPSSLETSGIVVRPWTRFGHDRIYVNDPSGQELGHLDKNTGVVTVVDESKRALVEEALAEFVASRS